MEPATAAMLASAASSAAKSSDTDSDGGVVSKVGEVIASPITGAVKLGAAVIPGKLEREQKKEYKAIRARVAAGKGGMSATELAKHRGVAESSTARAKANLASQMSRGASSAGGVGGQAFEQMRQSSRALEGKELQEKSDIRKQDLDQAVKLREYANKLRNQMMAQKAEALGMGIEAYQEMEPALTAAGETIRADKGATTAGVTPKAQSVADASQAGQIPR